ncbi:MAG TPA: CopD family protein [Flavisolibacter sp.]
MYLYLKALHIIFMVTWFAGMFYIVRLFIYNTEAHEKPEPERSILLQQLGIMSRRLWYGITWPSAILTLILGPWVMFHKEFGWYRMLEIPAGRWLLVKLAFVLLLYIYHYSLHIIYRQQARGIFRFSSQKLRLWNEVATVLLVAIVMLASVKQSLSFVWGLVGLVGFILLLLLGIRIYKAVRQG